MGKYWKYLHSMVYILAIFSLAHVAFLDISRAMYRDPHASIWMAVPMILVPFGLYAVGKYMEWTGRKIYSPGK
jgi:DMSO/TMAO reductase YedYZ heme-binding membrane subunit